MRNFKKVVALVLALAMVLSMNTVTFAAEMTAAEKAETLMLLKGDGNGVTAEYLAKAPLRIQAAIISLRLAGLEDEATAYEGTEEFADNADVTWAAGQNVLSYLKANPELGWQGDGTNFMPNDPVSAQQFVKVMLEVLGYVQGTDFEYADVFTFAATVGLTALTADSVMTNDSLAVGMVDALAAETAAGGTLLDKLIADEVITEELAITAGLKEAAPAELAVVSVTATNLKQLVVTYNTAVDATTAETAANYDVTDVTAGAVTVSDASLAADGVTVTLTLDVAADQQDVVDVTISDVEDANEVVMADTTVEDIEFIDMTIPTVVSAAVVGIDTIKVTFSEPVMGDEDINAATDVDTVNELPTANFTVQGTNKLYVKSVTLQNNGTEAMVELYSDLAADVTITVTNDTEDFAGFGVVQTALSVPVVVDSAAPTVVGYKDATPTGVTLIWSEDIEIQDAAKANYYHTNSSNVIDANLVAADVDGTEMTLDFTTNELPQGTAYVYVLADAVNDLWDNDSAQQMIKVEVELDVTAPEVDGDVDVKTESTAQVNFTEDMDADTVTDEDNYTLLDSTGDEADLITSVTVVDADTVLVTFDEDLSGDYSLVIVDVEDLNGNAIADTSLPFTVDDLTAPVPGDFTATIYNPGAADQMIVVNFGDVMATDGAYSILDTAKYAFNGGAYYLADADPDLVSFNVINDGKSVEIVVPSTVDDPVAGDYVGVDLNAGQDIIMGKVADAAGNVTPGVTATIANANISNEGNVANPTVEITAVDTVVMTFDEEVSKLEVSDFVVEETVGGADLEIASVGTSLDSDGNTVVTFELVTDLTADALSGTSSVQVTATSQASENAYGETVNAFTVVGSDEIAPTVSSVVFNSATQIIVTFDEDLEADFFAGAGVNGFAVSEGTLNSATYVVADGNQVVLTGTDFTATANVTYTAGSLEDQNDNALASFSHTDTLAILTATEAATPNATATLALSVVDETYTAGNVDLTDNAGVVAGASVGDFEFLISGVGSLDTTDLGDDDNVNVAVATTGVITFTLTDADDDSDGESVTVTITHVPTGAVETVTLTFAATNTVVVEQ